MGRVAAIALSLLAEPQPLEMAEAQLLGEVSLALGAESVVLAEQTLLGAVVLVATAPLEGLAQTPTRLLVAHLLEAVVVVAAAPLALALTLGKMLEAAAAAPAF